MVEDIHDYHGRDAAARPRVVSPRFTQAVAGYLARDAHGRNRRADYTPRLYPADMPAVPAVPGEDEAAAPSARVIHTQGVNGLPAQRDCLLLACFSLRYRYMCMEPSSLFVVHLGPCQPQQIADAQRGARPQHDERVIAKLTPPEVIVRELF